MIEVEYKEDSEGYCCCCHREICGVNIVKVTWVQFDLCGDCANQLTAELTLSVGFSKFLLQKEGD